jgi:hypothetical protein
MGREEIIKNIQENIERHEPLDIERASVYENSLYVLPRGVGRKLVFGDFIQDFQFDGFVVFNISDVSDLILNRTVLFQNQMLKNENLESQIPTFPPPSLDSWNSFFRDSWINEKIIIIHCESLEYEEECYFGKVIQVNLDSIEVRTYNTAGEWEEEIETIFIKDITLVSLDTRYTTMCSKYLK